MLVQTPPMGWNSWNTFGTDINEQIVMETADAIVRLGLDKAGYKYVVVDDGWSSNDRDPVTGRIVPNPEKFPHGMKYVADYVHSLGLKFGIYSCAGLRTCANLPASLDHEYLDAQTFADFGADLLKYDGCFIPPNIDIHLLYRRMGMALKATGRDILFSLCTGDHSKQWAREVGGHMYRSTGDISDCFESYKNILMAQDQNFCYSAPGCFNDLDMLTVGMNGNGLVSTSNYSYEEYRAQFSMWCMFGTPLMLGCDVRTLSPELVELLTNPRLLRINQDPECRPPYKMAHLGYQNFDKNIYWKHLSDNEYALAYFNYSNGWADTHTCFSDFGLSNESGMGLGITDAFTGEYVGTYKEYFAPRVQSHGTRVFTAKVVKL